MSLSAGSRLGPYEILVPIGTGGMGEVYRARDVRLGREVAIKVLAAGLTVDRDFIKRFEQEARTASALNHPNIITIYDIGAENDLHFIAMELVEGKTLRELLREGVMPVRQAIRIGSQIADGLAKAHGAGVVHRDLKPANIMITQDGYVKILDFGLAKVYAPGALKSVTQHSTHSRTQSGLLLGTVGYMSPEQSEGKPIDARSDQFSFGSLLYEMATGRRAFDEPTDVRTLMAIVAEEPEAIEELNPLAPEPLCSVIRRCHAKDPDKRYAVTADLAAELRALREELTDASTASTLRARPAPRRAPWALVAVLLVAGVIVAFLKFGPASAPPPPAIAFGASRLLEQSEGRLFAPALSPDGKRVAFSREDDGQTDLYVRRVAAEAAVRLTHDAARELTPDFSPDGETLVFTRLRAGQRGSEICLIPSLGGQVKTILREATTPRWSPDGQRIAFVQYTAEGYALTTAAPDGSEPRVFLKGDAKHPFLYRPAWSPDGKQIVVVRSRGGSARGIWIVPLDGADPYFLSEGDSPVFTPDGHGIVCSSNRLGASNLWYLPLGDGDPVQVTKGAGPDRSPSIARDGTLLYHTSQWRDVLLVHDLESGRDRELLRHSAFLWGPNFSPDGTQIAFAKAQVEGDVDIWLIPVAGGDARQLTFEPSGVYSRFSPRGDEVFFHTWSQEERQRPWRAPVRGGKARPLTPDHTAEEGYADLSPDLTRIVFVRGDGGAERVFLHDRNTKETRRLTASPSTVPKWSHKGDWIVFARDRGYAGGIFVIRPDGSGERRVAERGGWPTWWPDDDRIGYLVVGPDGDQRIETVPLAGGPPTTLTGVAFRGTNFPFDISPDGKLLATTNSVHFLSEIWLMQPLAAGR